MNYLSLLFAQVSSCIVLNGLIRKLSKIISDELFDGFKVYFILKIQ